MRGWRKPALAWLALAVYLLPATAFAQATKAGVVTTLEGNVTAARAVAAQPVVLKFKDDVFLQDRVVTGEQSFARLLLGGKAVVSIRERSAVTITEVPGRSTIDIESGKIALSVARDRMQPGEVINIKTPNAVAGVRGTVVVAQVAYSLVGGAQQPASNLWVLRGVIEAVHTNAAGVAIGVPVPVGAMQSFSATPTSAATGTFTLQQMSGIVQGLQAKGTADPGTASQGPARLEAVNTAVALLAALTGSPAVQHLATGTSPEITTPTATQPEAKITEAGDITSSPVVPGGSGLPQLPQAPPPPVNTTTLQSGQSLLTFTGNEVQSSDGTPIVPTTDPLLSPTGSTIMQQGPDDLVVAKPDTNVTLPGPLLKLTDTSVQAGDAFLSVAGRVTSTSPQPFIDLDPTMVMAPGNLVEVVGPNGALGLAGGLVKDTGGTVNVGGSVVSVSAGGTLTSTGPGPLVQLNGTTTTASSLLSAVGSVGDSSSSATLRGTLLSTQGGSLNISGIALADISNGGRVSSSSTQPFVNIVGTALTLPESTFVVSGGRLAVGGSLLRVESLPAGTSFGLLVDNGGVVTVGGPVFDIVNSIAGVRIVLGNGSVLTSQGGPLVRVAGPTGTLTSLLVSDTLVTTDGTGNGLTLRGPALDASNAIVAISRLYGPGPFDAVALRLNPGDPVVRLDSSVMAVSAANEPFLSRGAAAGQDRTQAGVSLIATGTARPSQLAVSGSLLRLGTIELTDPFAQIQLSNSSVVYAGNDPALRVIDVAGPATISSSLVSLVNGSIGAAVAAQPPTTSGGSTVVVLPGPPANNGSLIGVRGSLTSGQAPLVSVNGGASSITGFQRVLGVEPNAALGLGGSVLSLVDGTVTAGTILGFNAPVTTAAAAAIAVSGGALLASDALLSATATLALGGGLLAQSGGNIATGGAAVASIIGTTLTSSPSAIFQLTGGSLSALGLRRDGDLLRASAASVNLGGTLLDSQSAAVSLAGAVATLNNGSRLIQDAGPFVSVRGGSFNADALLRADGTGNTFALAGTVLDLTDTTARLGLIADFPDQGTDGATLLLAPGEPAARVTRSTLRIDRGPFVTLVSAAETGCSPCSGVGTFSGVALISTGTAATPSNITVADELVALGTVDFVGTEPIAQLTRTTVRQTGDGSAFISWAPDGTFGPRSTTKPLLAATDSNLDVPGRAIFQFGGARLVASTGGAPFLSLTNTTVNAGWLVDMLSGQLEVAGPLAAFSGGDSTIAGALLRIIGGASVITSAASAAASIAGGTHRFGWIFELDNGGVTENQVVTGFGASPDVTLQLGTTQPLRQDSGVLQAPLLSASNATIDAATGLRLDTVRLDTLSRLFDFTNSTVTGGSLGFIDLARSARLVANIPDSGLVNLFHSSMTLSGGALARVRGAPTTGGSLLQIGAPAAAGSLVSMAGGSTLTLLTNAPLLSVTDGSAAQIFGSLISFVGTGNTVTVDNNLCLAYICSPVNGVQVARGANVLLSSIRIETDPISGLAGSNKLNIGADDALILIDGADSRLLIAGTGPDVPEVVINETFIMGRTLKTFTDISTRSGISPLISITGSTIADEGSDSTLVVAATGANATLVAGPLMKVTGSTLDVFRLLLVQKQGTLTSLGASPLIALDPVTVNATTLIEIEAGGKLSLAGPLLTDLNGRVATKQDAIVVAGTLTSSGAAALVGLQGTTLTAGLAGTQASLFKITGPVTLAGGLLETTDAHVTADGFGVRIEGGSVVMAGSTAPLIKLTGTAPGTSTVTTGDQLVRLLGSPASTMTLSGPLLEAVRTTITTGNPALNTSGLVTVHDGATLTSTALAPLISLDHSTLDLGGSVLGVRKSPSALLPSTVTLSDRVLRAVDSVVTTTTTGFDANFGTTFHGNCCSVLSVQQGALLVTKNDVPLLELIGSTLNAGPDKESGGSLFNVRDTFNGAPATGQTAELIAAATATLAGQVLVARRSASTPSIVSALGDFMQVWRSTLTSATTKPLIDLGADTQLTLGGANPLTDPPTPTGGRLLEVTAGITNTVNGPVGPGTAQVSLAGPLLSSVNATIVATDDLVGLFDGAKLESKTTEPFVSISGGSVKLGTAGSFFTMTSAAGQAAATATLQGPLLKATGATLQNGTPDVLSSGSTSFVALADGATLTTSLATTEPLITLANAKIDTAGNFFDIRRGASVTLHGALLKADDSTVDTTSLGFGTSNCCHGVRLGQGGSLTGLGSAPLIQLTRSTFNAGPDVGPNPQSGGLVVRLVDVGTVATDVASASTMTLAGPLLTSTDSFVTALNSFMTVDRSKFKATTEESLIKISGTGTGGQSLRLGGPNPFSTPTPNAEVFSRLLTVFGGSTTSPGPVEPADSSVSLAGPLLSASGASLTMTGDVIGVDNGAKLDSSTGLALIALSGGTTLKAGSVSAGFSGDILEVGGLGGTNKTTPGSVTLHGPLLDVSGSSNVELTGRLVNLFDGGQVTVQGTTEPFITLDGGFHNLSTGPGNTAQISVSSSAGMPASSMTLSGPLLKAAQANIILSNQPANAAGTTTSGMMFIGDSSTLDSKTTAALFSFGSVTYTAPGFMSVRRSRTAAAPTTVTLEGPLFAATDGSIFTLGSGGNAPGGMGATCCTPFFVAQGARLISHTPDALIQLTGSTLDNRDPVRSGSDIFAVVDTYSTAPAGELIAAARAELAGGLVRSTNGQIEALFNLVNVVRSTLTSTGSAPLIEINGGSVILGGPNPFSTPTPNQETLGRLLNVFAGPITTPVALPSADASVSLAGPLLLASAGSTMTMTDVIGIFRGASVVRETGGLETAFIGLDATRLEVGRNAVSGVTNIDGSVANITGVGGTSGTMGSSLTLKSGGALLEAKNGAFVDVRGANGNVVRLDSALLDATAPVIALIGLGTQLQTSNHAISVNNNSTVESRSPEAFIRLESQARMDVLAGHLVNVSASKLNVAGDLVKVSASRLNVAGDLVRMTNNATLNVNGLLLNILSGSTVNINGALVGFFGNVNTINITNNILPTTFINGIPVSIAPGASVNIASGSLAGLNTNGTIKINNALLPSGAIAASGSLIKVDANATLRIGPPSLPN